MSYEFPASIEREVERYAEEAHLSPAAVAVQLVLSGLEKAHKPEATGELSKEEWERLRANPPFALIQSIPDSVIDIVETNVRERRGEADPPRG